MMKRLFSILLSAVMVFAMFGCSKQASPASNTTSKTTTYTAAEKGSFYRQLDAILLATAANKADPHSTNCSLTEQQDSLYLNMTIQSTPVQFYLNVPGTTLQTSTEGNLKSFELISRNFTVVDSAVLLQDYREHLTALGANVSTFMQADMDGDSSLEALVVVENYAENWLQNTSGADSLRDAMSGLKLCLMVDTNELNNMVCHGTVLPNYVSDISSVVWDNGMVHILYDGNKIYRVFAGDCSASTEGYRFNEASLRQLCSRYITYLEDQGYTDVHLRLADICSAPGQEVLCCYSNGETYTSLVLVPYLGRLQPLYTLSGSTGALFIVDIQNSYYLLEYVQTLESDYLQNYRYQLFRFGDSFDIQIEDQAQIQIGADQGGGAEGTAFFDTIKVFLQNAHVCYDPYRLTGYETMQNPTESESLRPEQKYLRISNCSTNKVGTVKINNADSWLNFRTGPSTGYSKVLINPSDSGSFVKQVLGSPMTVIEPINTNDSENPIWVRIRISYHGRNLEGYSSQRYVDIDGIKHISAGSSFTVTADTNDTGLHWSCSDTSVASIDSTTGKLTAIRKGLVLITVVSETGLSDSCLIMID